MSGSLEKFLHEKAKNKFFYELSSQPHIYAQTRSATMHLRIAAFNNAAGQKNNMKWKSDKTI